ncbi:ferritin-like protein [Kitasatospora sp. NPDC056138]|uniref:ferritin-like domain-containing protein n=1 Tax=Kitasatospora sp. NPDC056138 TaxID=3345724 RepID=UPI0035DF9F00
MSDPVENGTGRRLPSLGRRGFLRSATLATGAPALLAGTASAGPRGEGPGAVAEAAGAAVAGAVGSVVQLMGVARDRRDVSWIRSALQAAVELELATIPPYLCGWWSIRDRSGEPARLIERIIADEMYHMGLACNLLVAVGGSPKITAAVPTYPGPLPGGVRSGLTVYLSGLTKPYVRDVLMGIETPEAPLTREVGPPTIGAFYDALLAAFRAVRPAVSEAGQLTLRIGPNRLTRVRGLGGVETAIRTIKEQGEGTSASPDEPFGDDFPAHYYAFGEIYHERRLRQTGRAWEYSGEAVPFPDTRPMGVVPPGGWPSPPDEVRQLLRQFDETFARVLEGLETAWERGDRDALDDAVYAMFHLEAPAIRLMGIALPDGTGTYGPEFRPVR